MDYFLMNRLADGLADSLTESLAFMTFVRGSFLV